VKSSSPEIPTAPGLPVLGNSFQFLRDTTGFLRDSYEQLGPVFKIRAGWINFTVLGGFEARRFLLDGAEQYLSRESFFSEVGKQLGNTAFVLGTSGDAHRRLRQLLSLAYSREVASPYVPAMIEATREALASWRDGETVSVMEPITAIAFEQYCRVMTKRSLREHYRDSRLVVDTTMNVGGRTWPMFMFKLHLPYKAARKRVLALADQIVAEHRAAGAPVTAPDIVDTLLSARDHDGQSLNDEEIRCYALYGFAGSCAYLNRLVGFMLYEILKDRDLRARLTAEVDAAFAAGIENAADLRAMKLLVATYHESCRLHPVSQGLPFLVEKDFEFEGKWIRRGETVVFTQVPMLFSACPFSNPRKFDAERCQPPRNEHRKMGAHNPFGMGHRTCTATGLIELMSLTMVATILHELDLEMSPPDWPLRVRVMPLPGPTKAFRVNVRRRAESDRKRDKLDAEERSTAEFPVADAGLLESALARAEQRSVPAGETIIREGDAADFFYLLIDGEVEVSKRGSDRGKEIVARLGPGDYFGEVGILCGIPRTATVRVTPAGPARMAALPREAFLELVGQSDLIQEEIAGLMRKRFVGARFAEMLPVLGAQTLLRMLPEFTAERRAPGEVIILEGDAPDRFYLITSGRVEVTATCPGTGRQNHLATIETGGWFGEIGMLTGVPRTATVAVTGDTPAELLSTGRDGFRALINESGGFRGELMLTMARRILSRSA
jgi:CRP-like cAMP-binding protein/cytochrome P450